MYIAYIMRGVHGSGKTPLARVLAGQHGIIHSTLDFFMKDGEFLYQSGQVKEYEELNIEAFRKSLQERIPVVVCDNPNLHAFQYEPYVEAAKAHGYKWAFVEMPHPEDVIEAAKQSAHGFSADHIENMIRDFIIFAGR